jgi:formate/nitrite transporter FocA (FNT family)
MLRRIDFCFKDAELDKAYNAERRAYYARIMPVMAGVMLGFSLVFEIIYRAHFDETGKSEE